MRDFYLVCVAIVDKKNLKNLLFVKAAKALALSICFLPILGCALGTGVLYGHLVRAVAYSPDNEDILFNYATLGFAFIETFAFVLFFAAILVFSM